MAYCHRYLGYVVVAALFGVVAAGCGGSNRLATAAATGKVSYNGKPLSFGCVLFVSETGPPARGAIKPDGTFQLRTYKDGDGAIVGKHRVQVACTGDQGPNAPPQPTNGEPHPGKSLVPSKYSAYMTSGLTFAVSADANANHFMIDLKD